MSRAFLMVLAFLVSCAPIAGPGDGGGGDGGGNGTGGGTANGGGTGGGIANGGGTGGNGGGVADSGPPVEPGDAGTADVTFTIRADQNVHPISPLIYGTNQPVDVAKNRYGLLRSGGNRLTAFNWENNASNAGSDWNYQNDDYLSASNTPGAAITPMVNSAKSVGAAALLTIPIVDYVAADKLGNGDVRNSGANYLQTRFKQNRANKGSALSTTPDSSDAYVNQDEYVNWAKGAFTGTQILFSLDNEPDLWSETHPEVHPTRVGYVELCTRNATYAAMVKRVWPQAIVTGFVSYGWNGYLWLQGAPDQGTKGEFLNYYLDQMSAASADAGTRLVDALDLHWYPEAQGGGVRIIGTETTAAVVAARVQAPRSLWDPSYVETSWITNSTGNKAVRLIPMLRERIAARFPGTKLAFTEWNYGAGNHISGAVATADALGVFGREAVEYATHWKLQNNEPYADAAMRVFRNYDAMGHGFGDTSIDAKSSAVEKASVYASLDAAQPSRVVIVVVNRANAVTQAALTLAHSSTFTKAKVFTLTSSSVELMPAADLNAVGTNAFRYAMPAMSVSVLVPMP